MTGPALAAIVAAAAVLAWPGRASAGARLLALPGPDAVHPVPDRGLGRFLSRGRRWLASRRAGPAARRSLDRERAVVVLLEGLSAALRAGLTPAQACEQVARSAGRVETGGGGDPLEGLADRLAAQASMGAPLEPALRAAADRLTSPALLAAAAGLAMAERHGAPVVDVLDGLVAALRDAARSAAAVEVALAAPRATATLLGALPLAGIALGELVGVDPVAVLVGAPLGRVALVLGLAATWIGRIWMRRLVRQVERG